MKSTFKRFCTVGLTALTVACLASAASAISVSNVTTDNEHPSYLGTYSVDGNDEQFWHTDWEAGATEPPFIITYELDNTYEITSLGFLPRQDSNLNGLIYWFNINVSTDGENYTTAQEVDWFEYTYDLQTVDLETPVQAKYIQLEVFESETYTNCSLNQLYINGEAVTLSDDAKAAEEAAAAEAEAAAEAALQAQLEANGFKSVISADEHASYPAVYAGNGDTATFWHTDWEAGPQVPPYTITFELDNLYSVSEISLTPRPDAQADGTVNGAFIDFNIYGSTDGENFTLAQAVTGLEPTLDVKTITLDNPVTTRYIRLEATLTAGETFASLNELDYVGTVVEEAPETAAPVESADTAPAAPETTAPVETVPETEAPAEIVTPGTDAPAAVEDKAPQTGDAAALVIAVLAAVSAIGIVAMRKRKN